MSLNISTQYPGQSNAPTTAYPYGSTKNVSSPGAGDGTPVDQAWVNDWIGFQQASLQKAGITPSGSPDSAIFSDLLNALQTITSASSASIGFAVNSRMYVASASVSATFTADEVTVATGFGGRAYKISSVSKTINVSTTGSGGMDTGSVPASGFVGIYLIYNPTTQASALLAVNATSSAVSEVYAGSNMPSGYTASALVSVWRVSSSQLQPGIQRGRSIGTQQVTLLNTSTPTTTATSLSTTAGIPLNAQSAQFAVNVSNSSSGSAVGFVLYSDANGIGAQGQLASISSGTMANGMIVKLMISSPGIIVYGMNNTSPGTFTIRSVEYTF